MGPTCRRPRSTSNRGARPANGTTWRRLGRSRGSCSTSPRPTRRSRSGSAAATTCRGTRTWPSSDGSPSDISSRHTPSTARQRRSWTKRSSGPAERRSRTCIERRSARKRSVPSRNGSIPSESASSGRRTSPSYQGTKLHKPTLNTKRLGRGPMLKECRSHGYFRDEFCPHCGDEGKFLLNNEEVETLGRTMAGVLRHFPERYGLEMDAHGWVDLRDFLTAIQIRNRRFRFVRQHHVVGLIETDPKGRYQFEDGKIRATYGHSMDVDLDLPTEGIPDVLFYPTTEEESHLLMDAGLRPSDRKMVHLSGTFEAAMEAGRVRIQAPVILEVDAKAARANGVVIHKAGKTVYTSKEVPGEFLRRSTRVEEELPSEPPADTTD